MPTEDDPLTYTHESVVDGDFSGRRLTTFISVESRFERCRFERTRIDTASFGAGTAVSTFVDCSFDGSRWAYVAGGWSRFERCSFRNIDVRKWNGEHTELIDCVFSGRLRMSQFWGVYPRDQMLARYENHARWHEKQGWGPLPDAVRTMMLRERNEFHGNDFTDADLIDVGFRGGIDLSRQILPTGADYLYLPDARASIERALALLPDRVPAELAPDVGSLLRDLLDRQVATGQRQILAREKTYERRKQVPAYITAAFALLRETLT